MEFVQIVECRSTRIDELKALEDEWEAATEGKRTLRRAVVGQDRNDPERFFIIAFFDDYESAMVNSNLPETQEFGQKQQALLSAPPIFIDLDVVDQRS